MVIKSMRRTTALIFPILTGLLGCAHAYDPEVGVITSAPSPEHEGFLYTVKTVHKGAKIYALGQDKDSYVVCCVVLDEEIKSPNGREAFFSNADDDSGTTIQHVYRVTLPKSIPVKFNMTLAVWNITSAKIRASGGYTLVNGGKSSSLTSCLASEGMNIYVRPERGNPINYYVNFGYSVEGGDCPGM
jgi:hypothetical protein